jgi:hypothetical protein
VLVARGSRVGIAGQHTTRTLLRTERVTVDGLPALAPIRMVLDSTFRMPHSRAVELVESAIVRGLVGPIALERRARELRHAKRPGCAITLAVLGELHPELAHARNEWEALVVRRAAREFGLDTPSLQLEIVVEGRRYFADAAWGDVLVLLEFDGRDPHMRRRVHDHDSIRRDDLTSAGCLRYSVTADALRRGDDRVFRQVAAEITRRRRSAG